MIKAFLFVLVIGRLEAQAAFLGKAIVDPIGTRWQIFLEPSALWNGIAIGWFLGMLTIGVLIAYADRIYEEETETSLNAGKHIYTEKRKKSGIDADRHRFW